MPREAYIRSTAYAEASVQPRNNVPRFIGLPNTDFTSTNARFFLKDSGDFAESSRDDIIILDRLNSEPTVEPDDDLSPENLTPRGSSEHFPSGKSPENNTYLMPQVD
ncbi:hypothetical protein PVK06_005693 [Gossypium arboreum]|uniref:Uncharacterized protein n=1 Tax=Gossypium arboreum TaxID=29729 RepID=A0ABR0QWA0_GOSAR|nr:hypothetical protein PVK06_005693 [Gossypium arboreum]